MHKAGAGEPGAVYIVAAPNDVHALRVKEEVQYFGCDCHIVDLSTLDSLELTLPASVDAAPSASWNGRPLNRTDSVWLRRPGLKQIDPHVVDDDLRRFVLREWRDAINSSLRAAGCALVNEPAATAEATKPWQIRSALESGLRVPESLITNNSKDAESFRERCKREGWRTIYKPLTFLNYHMGETRELPPLNELEETLHVSPVILQRCIEKGFDVRVFVAGCYMKGARIQTRYDELIDWRLDPACTCVGWDIPGPVQHGIARLMRRLGLQTASLDLRVDENGDIFFFEANPGGQFLFVEDETKSNLSRELARLLIARRKDPHCPSG